MITHYSHLTSSHPITHISPQHISHHAHHTSLTSNSTFQRTHHSHHPHLTTSLTYHITQSMKNSTRNPRRRSSRAEKYENYHAKQIQDHPDPRKIKELGLKCTSKKLKSRKLRELRCKFKTIPDQWKARELQLKMHIERSWRAEKIRYFPRKNPSGPVQDHRRTPKSTRTITKHEHRRSWRAWNDHRRHPDSTRIATQHENLKHETTRITTNLVRKLLSNPAFFSYRRTPRVKHTASGKEENCKINFSSSSLSPDS